jgi:predicted P-loop ATPase
MRPVWLISGDITIPAAHLREECDVIALDCAPSDTAARDALIWRPGDAQGREQAAAVATRLLNSKTPPARLRVVIAADGWDIADRIISDPELWTFDTLDGFANRFSTEPKSSRPAQAVTAKATKPEAETSPAYILWEQLNLARNDRGPYATEANALRIMLAHESYAGRIWLDEFAQRLMLDTEGGATPLDEIRMIGMQVWMQETLQLPKMPLMAIERAARLAGDRNRRHPVRQWLQGLAWDGNERLPTLMADGFGAPQNDYTAAVGRCWLTAMVARVMSPGCQADYMPVFEGEQGIRKSSAMRILGGEWFTESSEDPINGRKDFLQSLQGKWLVEIPEMHSIASRFSGVEKIKAIISIRVDNYRAPYARNTIDYPRQCIFAGTTNAPEWNADPTGGRRFWPITCGSVNLDYLAEQRDQLFAEAVHRYTIGEPWHDVPVAKATVEQERRRQGDEWEQIIERFITEWPDRSDFRGVIWAPRKDPLEQLTIGMILGDALGIQEGRWTRSDQMRVSSSMHALGWRKLRSRDGELRTYVYRRQPKLDI